MISNKLCECGCGGFTNICIRTDKNSGVTKGYPNRFIRSHFHIKWNGGKHIDSRGYLNVREPLHPRAKNGYVLNHILIAEKILKRPISPPAVVHHIDNNMGKDLPFGLVICQNQTYHLLLHRRARALRACGHVNWRKCVYCKQWDDPTNLYISSTGRTICHRSCSSIHDKIYHHLHWAGREK